MAASITPEKSSGSFHEAGALPPSEERKEIIRKIRARTLSRASQPDPTSISDAISSMLSAQNTTANPQENTNSTEESSTIQDTKETKVLVEDDSWMLPDPSESPKPTQKPTKKKQLKRKTKSTSNLSDDEVDTGIKEIETVTPSMDEKLEEVGGNEGEWSTVINSKPKKQEEAQKKDTAQLSGARASQKTSESSKVDYRIQLYMLATNFYRSQLPSQLRIQLKAQNQ